MNFNKYCLENIVCGDGAFGTYYANKYNTEELPELANIKYPERVVEIHSEYLNAGASFIRTNTFAAYAENVGDEVDVTDLRKKAVELAKKAVELSDTIISLEKMGVSTEKVDISATEESKKSNDIDNESADFGKADINKRNVYIAGDIGPAPFEPGKNMSEVYVEFADDLVSAGVDILLFETFSDMDELEDAFEVIKNKYPEVSIMVSFAVNQYGSSTTGRNAARLLEEAISNKNVSGAGLNCNLGPAHMAVLLQTLSVNTEKIITAFPNAGYPKLVRDRIIYADNAEYFAEKMKEIIGFGVDIVGGCCGTKPEHIKKLFANTNTDKIKRTVFENSAGKTDTVSKNVAFFADKKAGEKIIAVELNPPLNVDDEGLLKSANYLKELGVDCLTFPDSPSGRTRVDAVLMAKKIKDKTGLPVMPHIACRDKNAIAMRSQFMGAYLNEIYNFLLVTGDPVPVTERGKIKGVFNFDSTGLMSIAADMNRELFEKAPLVYGGAINQTRKNFEVEIKRVEKKMERGAKFFMTQPVFTDEDADKIRLIKERTGARILCGIMPLISRKNALFMKNEISGVNVSDEIVNMFPENTTREQGEEIGVAIAKQSMAKTADFADGYYFSFPFNRVYLLEKLLG